MSKPGPNSEWWGRLECPSSLNARRELVLRRTAAVLEVPLHEVDVMEDVEPEGVRLTAMWVPR